MAMLPKKMVRVKDVFILNNSKTSVTLTILFGTIAMKLGATLSLSATYRYRTLTCIVRGCLSNFSLNVDTLFRQDCLNSFFGGFGDR